MESELENVEATTLLRVLKQEGYLTGKDKRRIDKATRSD